MKIQQNIPIVEKTHLAENNTQQGGDGLSVGFENKKYMKTKEAAEYLRKSVSWLVRQADIPYVPGKPNIYRRQDLDACVERRMRYPKVAA